MILWMQIKWEIAKWGIGMWGMPQWGYVLTFILSTYFLILSFIWMRGRKYKVGPFFYYVAALVIGLWLASLTAGIARHYLLIGYPEVRNAIIVSKWWALQALIPPAVLVPMCVHATVRFFRYGHRGLPQREEIEK